VAENLELFARMRAGEFDEGECVLRAKIDMASPNMNLRDPALPHPNASHQRTGDEWCIYPMYDFAHTSRMRSRASRTRCARWSSRTTGRCTTGFSTSCLGAASAAADRVLAPEPEFTVMSKRMLSALVEGGYVAAGTIRGCRRFAACAGADMAPDAIRDFCAASGSRRRRIRSRWACWRTAFARSSNARRRA
jgi:glutaminyl-tRNA synthetase